MKGLYMMNYKYLLAFFACGSFLTFISIWMHAAVEASFGHIPAHIISAIFIFVSLGLWQLINNLFNLDKRDKTEQFQTEKYNLGRQIEAEKLFIAHEYRRLHELDYEEFVRSIQKGFQI
jgi:hypothetical protein